MQLMNAGVMFFRHSFHVFSRFPLLLRPTLFLLYFHHFSTSFCILAYTSSLIIAFVQAMNFSVVAMTQWAQRYVVQVFFLAG